MPRVLRSGVVGGRTALVVEYLPGARLASFNGLPTEAIAALGEDIGRIHARRCDWWGAPSGAARQPLDTSHPRLAATRRGHVARFFAHDAALTGALAAACALAARLPPPEDVTLVMIDVDATQFLTKGGQLTVPVDTDAYIVAPRALDLIGYEFELDQARATAFARGYRAVLHLPDLSLARPLYRYLYRLLESQGRVPLPIWQGWPAHFDRP